MHAHQVAVCSISCETQLIIYLQFLLDLILICVCVSCSVLHVIVQWVEHPPSGISISLYTMWRKSPAPTGDIDLIIVCWSPIVYSGPG